MPGNPTGTSHPSPSALARGVLDDLEASPTPYHAVERAVELLSAAGFDAVDDAEPLPTGPGARYLQREGSLIAWSQPEAPSGYLVVGAHTDSPNLRLRTQPDVSAASFSQVGVEVYGGVLLNSWLDRDLGLAGRVSVATGSGAVDGTVDSTVESRLFRTDQPILRIPQLAIHLDRDIREKGLLLNPQKHLTPLWAVGEGEDGDVKRYVAAQLDVDPERILAWDLMTFDTQPPAVVGRDGDMFAAARIDNLVSAFCGVRALVDVVGRSTELARTPVLVLYDHEEIGSTTATGAAGPFLAATLERISAAIGLDRPAHLAELARSLVVSADGAHATHPNYVDRHEPSHQIALNEGVVIKRNANQRYATDATSEAFVVAACNEADVPLQYYIHRNDLPCGSTIGPITAARLGVPTIDVGVPQLAMHSVREMAGIADLDHLHRMLRTCWETPG